MGSGSASLLRVTSRVRCDEPRICRTETTPVAEAAVLRDDLRLAHWPEGLRCARAQLEWTRRGQNAAARTPATWAAT
jgi:hypothetical protein